MKLPWWGQILCVIFSPLLLVLFPLFIIFIVLMTIAAIPISIICEIFGFETPQWVSDFENDY